MNPSTMCGQMSPLLFCSMLLALLFLSQLAQAQQGDADDMLAEDYMLQ